MITNKLVAALNSVGASIHSNCRCPGISHSPKLHADLCIPIFVGGHQVVYQHRSSEEHGRWFVYPANYAGGSDYEEFKRYTDAMNYAVEEALHDQQQTV